MIMKKSNYKSSFDMHLNATENIQNKAKELRKNMTNAEKLLWSKINNKQLLGFKFRRQHPIDIFISDFYCHKAKLIIEVDGDIHKKAENKDYDINRTAELENNGIKIIRFTNNEIETNIEEAVEKIKQYLLMTT